MSFVLHVDGERWRAGHDRFLADLRPQVFKKLRLKSALVCHPYDICTALIAEEAGCVIEAPLGGKLSQPLDTTSAVTVAVIPGLRLRISHGAARSS